MRRVLADVLVVALAAAMLGFGGALLVESHLPPAAVSVASWA